MYEIRKIRSDEVEEAIALAWEVFLQFEAPDYKPEGTKAFLIDIVENEAFISKCRQGIFPIYAAFDQGNMIGIIGMRSKTHINMVFTRKEYHRQGVATSLFRYLLADLLKEDPALQELTLNASPYGIPFYLHLGFEPQSEEQEKHGIRYTPMKWRIPMNTSANTQTVNRNETMADSPAAKESSKAAKPEELFPDGTPIDPWFYEIQTPALSEMGRQYVLTDHGILDDGRIHTTEIQKLIDTAAAEGGGVLVVPAGTYLTGSLYFKQGVHLYVAAGGTLKGSDDISDYDVCQTRIEGETCTYFAALINGEGLDGFTMWGPGTIDGNGLRSWKAFWLRRTWNPACTNKDEQRPRLVYLSNCKNVLIADLNLQNSHFWTTHLYRCNHVKYVNCRIFSPAEPVKAPSTDAIDIDVCSDILVKNCYLEVNDDSVVLKGGKGPWADSAPENGSNERILVEDCVYGLCHGCLTCGSESVHNRNILIRRIKVLEGHNLLWLKMRPDTPQHYEYITVESIQGKIMNFINITPWTQFYDLKDRKDIPLSYADHITMRNCKCQCETFFHVKGDESQYLLSDFTFENLDIQAKDAGETFDVVKNMNARNVQAQTEK